MSKGVFYNYRQESYKFWIHLHSEKNISMGFHIPALFHTDTDVFDWHTEKERGVNIKSIVSHLKIFFFVVD